MKVSMKKIGLLGALAALTLLWPVKDAQAYGGVCRDYTKTSLLNGRVEISVAQACRDWGDRWEIVDLRGPVEMRDYMLGMIHRDLYAMNPRYVIINNPSVYYAPAPQRVVVYQQPQRVYVHKNPKYYSNAQHYKNNNHYKHDHRSDNRRDRDSRNDRHAGHDHNHRDRDDNRSDRRIGAWR